MYDVGFFPPTSGTAFVNGFDIRRDIEKVRTSLGLCPQHNILYDDLTVEEHLIFFTKVPPMLFLLLISNVLAIDIWCCVWLGALGVTGRMYVELSAQKFG